MKKLFVLLLAGLATTLAVQAGNVEAVKALAERVVPSVADRFEWRELPAKGGDRFRLYSGENGKIVIEGNNAGSMAVGLNHYLKYYCLVEVSWFAHDAVVVPQQLPAVEGVVESKASVENRFFLNYCTYGYTMPWWGWKDWERLIDWMALNGVNLPLAITGQESIWYKVWSKMGLSDEQIRAYFTGPAFLPWHRMINIDRWQGPLPMSWLEGQEALQKQIVVRERELNMHPVLPAFAGHVPSDLKEVLPDAKITTLKNWSRFPSDYACSYLDPMDPAFAKIQKLFLEEQRKAYGTDHIYGVDPFNEVVPPSWEPDYLARVSKQTYNSIKAVDKKATWLQMGWLFYHKRRQWTDERIEAYLGGAPQSKQLILDYYCERYEAWPITQSFFGTPFLWCYLGNFGGNSTLNAPLKAVNDNLERAIAEGGKNMVGIGSTLEGFDLTPFAFEYALEKAWDTPLHKDVAAWTEKMADQRIGKVDEQGRKAWSLLMDGLFCSPTYGAANYIEPTRPQPMLMIRPNLPEKYPWRENTLDDKRMLVESLDLLMAVESDTPAHRFDLVNFTRELMSTNFTIAYHRYHEAVAKGDLTAMGTWEKYMTNLLYDLDELLATNTTFLVGKWIEDARAIGVDEAEKDYYERNARCIVTSWGDEGAYLTDYARRMWAGLVGTYYAERWNLYFAAVKSAILTDGEFSKAHYDNFRKVVVRFEGEWWKNSVGDFSAEPVGDEIEVAKRMFAKYRK